MVEQVRVQMTAEQFFELPETMQITELLDGEVFVSPAPVPKHQRVTFQGAKYLDSIIPNGEVFIAPTSVYLDERNIPQPDYFWIAEGGKAIVGDKYIIGPPDLVVEVASPGTTLRDKQDKFKLYERHGVREYWMLDPELEIIEPWSLQDGKYMRIGAFGVNDNFESPVLLGRKVECGRLFGQQKETE